MEKIEATIQRISKYSNNFFRLVDIEMDMMKEFKEKIEKEEKKSNEDN